ncbi:MAG: NADH-ubiquinone oxidoreductase-F iron-sulfur binding region domain-containing protein [Candidatus Kuenenbacteria bacterium]
MKTNSLIKKIEQAGLLGRGCGTFPTAKKWQIVLNESEKEKYVICNVSESEPGIFKDEFILDNYPEKVIDGINLAVQVFKAKKGFIYLKPTYYQKFGQKLEVLIGDSPIELFGKKADDYIGGEESAMINLMEGNREQPRLKPPFVTSIGFLNKPTLVNNCETFYDIALINQDKYSHERFFCISGDKTLKGVFKFPEDYSVKKALEKSGLYPNFPFFAQLGGAMSGTCLRSDQLDDIVIQHYSGLVIHAKEKEENVLVLSWLKFFVEESCGQCVPCREGTYRLYNMYQHGEVNKELFKDILFTMENTSLCSFGKMAITAITSYYENIKQSPIEAAHTNLKCGA